MLLLKKNILEVMAPCRSRLVMALGHDPPISGREGCQWPPDSDAAAAAIGAKP